MEVMLGERSVNAHRIENFFSTRYVFSARFTGTRIEDNVACMVKSPQPALARSLSVASGALGDRS